MEPPAGREDGGSRILLVADAPVRDALALVREGYGLRRFGCRVDLLARPEVLESVGRYPGLGVLPPGGRDPESGFFDGLTAVLVAPSLDLLARVALGLHDSAGPAAVVGALRRGIPVFMDVDRLLERPGEDRNAYFNDMYTRYAAAAGEMGIRPVPGGGYTAALLDSGWNGKRKAVCAQGDSVFPSVPARSALLHGTPAKGEKRRARLPESLAWLLEDDGKRDGPRSPQPPGHPPCVRAPVSVPDDAAVPPHRRSFDLPARHTMVVTERDVLSRAEAGDGNGIREWRVPHDAVITPLARDTARRKGMRIIREEKPRPSGPDIKEILWK